MAQRMGALVNKNRISGAAVEGIGDLVVAHGS
jgi:hypothetical protein